ncbi:Sec-independent protein translocase protein TatB [Mesorhizobium australicum]|uniref:Sec-independent protein translocase protein TatB n=1 Tax=Mesorhizobium australicum TaxID=536018 RepID=A0A1X7PCI0_9HYPH|nr:sec-independent protein translocase protein TatB [Mesorhizobium australicum]
MLDVGWTEMLVIAIVMIVVVGPKDLPRMLRSFGRTTAKMRSMANDFRKQFDEALKEAELDDVKSSIDQLKGLNPASDIKKVLNPMEKAAADVRAGLQAALKPAPKPTTSPDAQPAEPLKAGTAAMPGETAAPAAVAEPSAPPVASTTADAPPAAPVAAQPAVAAAAKPKATRKKAGTKA